ncbi:MAG: 2'-5' RNA ligase family protein, partial [Alsobacter sp.]
QALAISAIAEKVAAGILPRESAVAQLMYSFKAPREAAEQMVPQTGFRPRAVESGLEAPPAEGAPAAPPPRTDAADRTMVALLEKLAPSGKCDDCGKRLPLEVDHVHGRGWDPAALSKQQRAAKYWQEHDDGKKLRALCRSCNGRDGALNKQGKSGPRHRSDAIDTSATMRFTYAPLPPEIVETMEALQAEVMPAGGMAQEIDHVTLVYCPKAATEIPEEKVAEVVDALRAAAAGSSPIAAKVQGWAYFDGARKDGEDKTVLVALIDAPGITQLQVRLQDALAVAGMEPSSAHSFAPHFTICYLAPGERVDELPAIAVEFTIDRICFVNREVHEIQLGGAAAPGQSRDPVVTVEAITPFQLRALAGEPRDSLVATLELALGVPAAMAERLIPQHPGPSGIDPDSDDDADEDLDDLDDDDDDDDLDEDDDERTDADDDPEVVDPEEIEERDDCDNPIRGEAGLFDGCAPGEGGGASAGAKASPSAKAAGGKAAPSRKLTPKQKAAAKAKTVREKAKAKIAKEKAKLKAKKAKERAKIKAAKEKAKAKIAAQKQKLQN